ncbi:class I SAM-dependent methyltransferase [Polaromonas sp. P1-6]|nr:class I SAM-dependent methyltransferase [Polaromonas sp. P1-6]
MGSFPHDAVESALYEEEWGRVTPEDDPYHYAHRLLGKLLPIQPPDFSARLRSRGGTVPVRLLSICSGTAAVELGIISASGVKVDATFVDINQSLIEQAIRRLPENCSGQCFVGNVNDIWPLPLKYDIIVCVSGLHHIVELEQTLAGIRDCLEPDGEFWVIGEQMGRNGNRLWPEEFEACNRVMSTLPQRYRVNAYSGAVDEKLPNHNFGSASFEGIRSEEIEGLVDRHFLPISVYRRNVFLWRLVNQTYSNNYDLKKEDDINALRQLVIAEAECWWRGGRPTELFAIFAPRRLTIEGVRKAALSI